MARRLAELTPDMCDIGQDLAVWPIQYDTVIPHHSPALCLPCNGSPITHPECPRDWTKTAVVGRRK